MLLEPVERWASTLGNAITIRNNTWDGFHTVAMPMVIESLFLVIPTRRIVDAESDWTTNGNHDTMSSMLLVYSNQEM
jgi:hypothetical protein